MKILTMVGTRPEIIRLSETIKLLDQHFEHRFVHSGQNMSTNMRDVFFEDLDLRLPDAQWEIDGSSLATIIGSTMANLERELKTFEPDALVTLGDTNTALAGLIAKRFGVITYHLEAGNRSFDENVPEEINRKVVDHFSDFNLAYSQNAIQNLLNEGLHPRRMMMCGSPMRQVINRIEDKIEISTALSKVGVEKEQYFLVSAHRQENVDNPARLQNLFDTLATVSREFDRPIVISLHPRTQNILQKTGIKTPKEFIVHEPFGFVDYISLQKNAFCVLSDSGTISEEASILRFPAVTIRDSMERPEALDAGAMIMCGLSELDILRAVNLARDTYKKNVCPAAYEVEDHAERVVKFIISTATRAHEWFGIRK
jgi:UDP-N-acetylglucosamine 2-epimerase (non-hydrolysing)